MKKPEPILVTALFPPTLENLIQLLDELAEGDWQKHTVCSGWSVKYVAQHLLGVEMSNISRKRDTYTQGTSKILTNNQELLEFINELNENWVHAADRTSPRLLIDLLSYSVAASHCAIPEPNPCLVRARCRLCHGHLFVEYGARAR